MNGLAVAELGNVIESALARIERHVKTYTPVETQHEEVEVVAQTYSRAESHFLQGVLKLELGALAITVVTQGPHIAGIYKGCSVKVAEKIKRYSRLSCSFMSPVWSRYDSFDSLVV